MVLSIEHIEQITPHELANVLDTVALILRRMPNETLAELKQQDREIIRLDLRNQ